MTLTLVRQQPARQLTELGRPAAVLATGAIGYLDAAEDDRRRWIAGFRALLDGLDAPLQVVVDFVPGLCDRQSMAWQPETEPGVLPAAGLRRDLDLAFAQTLRTSRSAQRRDVQLATTPSAVDALERGLRDVGVPDVRRIDWQPPAGLLFGRETPRAVEDCQGWHRTWWLERFPGVDLVPGWLLRLVPSGLRLSLGWHADRLPTAWVVDYLQRQLVHMRAAQMHRAGGVGDPQIEGAAPAAEALQQRLTARQESAFHVSVYLTVTTESPAELEAAAESVESSARSALCQLLPATFRQLDGRLATLPVGRDPMGRRRVLDTSSLATLFPWFDADLQEPTGLIIGTSRATGQPVLIDPFDDRRYANANIGIFGHSGAGKTYLLSTLTMSALSMGAQVFVVDPEHEYGGLARLLQGVDVKLALGSGHSINVLDLRGGSRDESTVGPAVADAVDLCSVICGDIDETERAVLELAVRQTFESVETPVLADVAARLSQSSRAGRVLARWVQGSLGQIFSRPTNVDLEAPLVVFGMRELRAEMVAPVHYLLAEALWARIKKRDRRRMLVIDELGLLFEDPTVRRFVVSLARRIRKYDGSLVFATQNPGDLLSGESGSVVATNPALHFFGTQRPVEAGKLQHAFHLSEAQRAGLETARRGEFLLAAGHQRLAIRVHAPPWQSAVMDLARAPPKPESAGCGCRLGAGGSRLLPVPDRVLDPVVPLVLRPQPVVQRPHSRTYFVNRGLCELGRAQAFRQRVDGEVTGFQRIDPHRLRHVRDVVERQLLVRSDDDPHGGLEEMMDLTGNDAAHLSVLQNAPPQRKHPEADVARLVPSDRGEPCDEAGQDTDLAKQAQRVALATESQIALDDEVVRNYGLHEGDLILGLEPAAVDGLRQLAVEDAPVSFASGRSEVGKRGANAALMTQDLLEIAVEEDSVPSFVGDLGGQEHALVLPRCRMQHGRQRVGHDLLAKEEEGHRRLERRLNRGRNVGPVPLVAVEVQVGHRPLLRLPAAVERGAVVFRAEECVHLGLDIVDGHVYELVERGLLDSANGL